MSKAMPHSAAAARSKADKTSAKLDEYRAKAAAMVHKASGDPEEVCKHGLAMYQALKPARRRANRTALPKDE